MANTLIYVVVAVVIIVAVVYGFRKWR